MPRNRGRKNWQTPNFDKDKGTIVKSSRFVNPDGSKTSIAKLLGGSMIEHNV